jgi:hypothetical protein
LIGWLPSSRTLAPRRRKNHLSPALR